MERGVRPRIEKESHSDAEYRRQRGLSTRRMRQTDGVEACRCSIERFHRIGRRAGYRRVFASMVVPRWTSIRRRVTSAQALPLAGVDRLQHALRGFRVHQFAVGELYVVKPPVEHSLCHQLAEDAFRCPASSRKSDTNLGGPPRSRRATSLGPQPCSRDRAGSTPRIPAASLVVRLTDPVLPVPACDNHASRGSSIGSERLPRRCNAGSPRVSRVPAWTHANAV